MLYLLSVLVSAEFWIGGVVVTLVTLLVARFVPVVKSVVKAVIG